MHLRMRLGLCLELSRGGVMHFNYFSSLVGPYIYSSYFLLKSVIQLHVH